MKQSTAPDTASQSEASQFQPPDIEEISRLFPQLEILLLIGKGGTGAVYRARQPALGRIVTLKILPPQVAAGPNFVERFNSEAPLNHPSIVAVYEFGQAGGLPYFIMEWP
jgi:serine/threonine protein kinase